LFGFGSWGKRARMLDAPRPISLVAIAVACAVLGFVVSRASLDVDRAAVARRADEARALGREAAPDSPEDVQVDADANAAAPGEAAAIGVERDAGTSASPGEAAPESPPPANAAAGEIIEGRVAYLRCEGLANVPPAGPCPRDHSVEASVWEAIRSLTSCPALATRFGSSDVRVVFDGRRMSGLGFRDVPDELDRESVRGCLEPALERVHTDLGTSRLTASFRFELLR